MYKQPKTGGKPPKLVPIVSNMRYAAGALHHTGQEIHPLVAAYRQVARGVDSTNQMALQMRLLGRQISWSQALRGFAAIRRGQRICNLPRPRTVPWQGKHVGVAVGPPSPPVLYRCANAPHHPRPRWRRPTARLCTLRQVRTQYVCSGCPDTLLHVQCFAPAHGITATGTDDAEESEPPLSQETHKEDAREDDLEANGEDEEEPDSDEEEEEEEAEDTRGTVEDDTLENFSFSVQ